VAFGSLGDRFLRRRSDGGPRNVATFGGYYGDSGSRHAGFLPWQDGSPPDELYAGVDDYRARTASRQIVRLAPVPTITSSPFSMLGTFALDERDLIPPLFPATRGEDLLFGQIVQLCFEDVVFCHLPWAVAHLPIDARVGSSDCLWDSEPFVTLSFILTQLLELARPVMRLAASGSSRLRLLGRCLQDAARLTTPAFLELVRDQVDQALGRFGFALARALERCRGHPPYWAADLARFIEHQARILQNPERARPLELARAADAAAAGERLKALVLTWGQLLEAWPELFHTARRAGSFAGLLAMLGSE
jgi:hypothetical protein